MKKPQIRKRLKSVLLTITAILAFLAALSNAPSQEPTSLRTFSNSKNKAEIGQEYTLLESEGGTYLGPVIDSVYTGAGKFNYLRDGVYEGNFVQSKREGRGTFTWDNGDKYVGAWINDTMVSGTYTFADGRSFTGTFKKGGFVDGTFSAPKGTLAKDIQSLQATFKSGSVVDLHIEKENGLIYSGEVMGNASIHYPSGNEYFGNVSNGEREGKGTFSWIEEGATVAHYQGGWHAGYMSGEGTYHFSEGEYPYLSGNFSQGHPKGTAIYYKEPDNTFSTTWSGGKCIGVVET